MIRKIDLINSNSLNATLENNNNISLFQTNKTVVFMSFLMFCTVIISCSTLFGIFFFIKKINNKSLQVNLFLLKKVFTFNLNLALI